MADDKPTDDTETGTAPTTPAERPSGGRDLAKEQRNRERKAQEKAERAQTRAAAENSRLPDDEDPSPQGGEDDDDEDDDPSDIAARSREEEAREPREWIWNHTHGIRPGIFSEPNRDSKGEIIVDGAGMPSWNTINVPLQPGLNAVPRSAWLKIRDGLRPRIRAGELEHVPADPRTGELAIKAGRLIRAVHETGIDDVLRGLAEIEKRGKVLEAIEDQLTTLARGGRARLQARRMQSVHTVR